MSGAKYRYLDTCRNHVSYVPHRSSGYRTAIKVPMDTPRGDPLPSGQGRIRVFGPTVAGTLLILVCIAPNPLRPLAAAPARPLDTCSICICSEVSNPEEG